MHLNIRFTLARMHTEEKCKYHKISTEKMILYQKENVHDRTTVKKM